MGKKGRLLAEVEMDENGYIDLPQAVRQVLEGKAGRPVNVGDEILFFEGADGELEIQLGASGTSQGRRGGKK